MATKIYTWFGGYALYECNLTPEIVEAVEEDDLEKVFQYLIDTDQIDKIIINNLSDEEYNQLLNSDVYVYVDNTISDYKEVANCYFVCIENFRIEKE